MFVLNNDTENIVCNEYADYQQYSLQVKYAFNAYRYVEIFCSIIEKFPKLIVNNTVGIPLYRENSKILILADRVPRNSLKEINILGWDVTG